MCHLTRDTNSRNKDIHVVKLKDADVNCTYSYGQKDAQFPNQFWQNSCKNQSFSLLSEVGPLLRLPSVQNVVPLL